MRTCTEELDEVAYAPARKNMPIDSCRGNLGVVSLQRLMALILNGRSPTSSYLLGVDKKQLRRPSTSLEHY